MDLDEIDSAGEGAGAGAGAQAAGSAEGGEISMLECIELVTKHASSAAEAAQIAQDLNQMADEEDAARHRQAEIQQPDRRRSSSCGTSERAVKVPCAGPGGTSGYGFDDGCAHRIGRSTGAGQWPWYSCRRVRR